MIYVCLYLGVRRGGGKPCKCTKSVKKGENAALLKTYRRQELLTVVIFRLACIFSLIGLTLLNKDVQR